MEICGDNRFEIIARAKADLLEGTNIETDEAEMAVIDNILFRCWQMGWLDRYDRKTEQTEREGEQMTYTEKELDQFLHGISLSLLSKKSAQHWRYDEETAKEIEWLEALERKVRADKADRKTDNSSEKPNNSTISKMEQVDEPTTQTETQNSNLTFEKVDEPQTDCPWK